jgi:DNA polymerase
MLQMARPRDIGPPLVWWHQTDPDKMIQLMLYCIQDVAAERQLDQVLPDLSPSERQVFDVDGQINRRGLLVDVGLVHRMIRLADTQMFILDQDMRRLTSGVRGRPAVKSCAQVGMLQTWLHMDQQCFVPDLRKHSVAEALAAVPHAPPKARAALLTRQEAARASTKKLNAMVVGRSNDDRVRGLFQYGGAGRTLRWAGRRVQPQNFPRGTIKHVDQALTLIQLDDTGTDDLTALFEDSAMGVLASCLRSCFIAAPGHTFAVADLAQIEARVVAWLAGQQDILDVFASGADVYTYTAQQQGSGNRQFGKVLVLACGFGMGPEKFQATAETYGVALDIQQAIDAVWDWRQNNPNIQHLWWDVGNAAQDIARGQDGDSIQVGFIELRRSRRAMKLILPSGREMIYHHVGLENDSKGRPNIIFMGVDPKTKQWSKQRTYGGKLVENIVQATARDVMAEAMVVLDHLGVPLVGTVHDELLAEPHTADAKGTMRSMLDTLRTTPSWAPGLPLAAEGWIGRRYRKA